MSDWKMKSSPRSAPVFAGAALAAAVGLGASLWSCGRTPSEAKGTLPPESRPPAPVAEAAPPQPAASPTEEPGSSTAERWQALGVGTAPSQAPATTMVAEARGFPTLPPLTMRGEPTPEPTPAPSDTEVLQEKIQRYRAEYGPAKTRVASLEREVAELAELATKVFADGNSSSATLNAEIVRARLSRARQELDNARQAASAIEERARRDGVGYGQLY